MPASIPSATAAMRVHDRVCTHAAGPRKASHGSRHVARLRDSLATKRRVVGAMRARQSRHDKHQWSLAKRVLATRSAQMRWSEHAVGSVIRAPLVGARDAHHDTDPRFIDGTGLAPASVPGILRAGAPKRGQPLQQAWSPGVECNSNSGHVDATHVGYKASRAQPVGATVSATSKARAVGEHQQSSSRPKELRKAFLAALALSRFPHRPVIIDLFGGSGGVARAVQSFGFAALLVTLEAGPHFDILDDDTYHTLRGWISSNQVSGLFSATPCEGHSRARRAPAWSRFPHMLRSNQYPRGLPDLNERDQRTLDRSNAISDRACALIQLAVARGIPVGEENPKTSFLWDQDNRLNLLTAASDDVVVDLCAFGRPFRARTRIVFWNCRAPTLHNKLCKQRGSLCSFTGKSHRVLTGVSNGGFLTRLKQEYPAKLSREIARTLVNGWNLKQASNLGQAFRSCHSSA